MVMTWLPHSTQIASDALSANAKYRKHLGNKRPTTWFVGVYVFVCVVVLGEEGKVGGVGCGVGCILKCLDIGITLTSPHTHIPLPPI